MRAVVQRVRRAAVSVDHDIVGQIGPGLCVLVGVAGGDTDEDARSLAEKIAHLRIFADEQGKFNRSVLEVGGQVLVVSQFTLLGDTSRGRRPGFTAAAPPENAEPLIEQVVERLRSLGLTVQTGRFRATMLVEIWNDGPVTLLLDTRHKRSDAVSF